eukprot:5087222-Pyramimonas_sp.AAC.1
MTWESSSSSPSRGRKCSPPAAETAVARPTENRIAPRLSAGCLDLARCQRGKCPGASPLAPATLFAANLTRPTLRRT